MAIPNIDSGYDLEVLLSGSALQHLLHLFFDSGMVDPEINALDARFTILTEQDDALRRTYSPADGFVSAGTTGGAFGCTVLDLDAAPDHVYLRVALFVTIPDSLPDPPGFALDAYVKLPRTFDGQGLFEALHDVIAGEAEKFYLAPYAEVVSIQFAGTGFDPEDPRAGPSFIPNTNLDLDDFLPLIRMFLDTGITDALNAAKRDHDEDPDEGNDLVKLIEGQLDLLGFARLDRVALRPFADDNRLGIYANFILLDHDRGFVGNRGDKESGADFLGSGPDLGLATAPGFIGHLVDDLLIKAILREDLDNGDLQEWEVEERLLFDHYPIRFPYSLIEDDISAPPAYIRDVAVSTVTKTFDVPDLGKLDLTALKINIKLDEYLFNLFELPSENFVVFAAPFIVQQNGLDVLDVYVETNLRLDVARSLFHVLGPLGWIATGIVNLFINKEMVEDTLSNLTGSRILATVPLLTRRWDPFYETRHGLLLESLTREVTEEQLLLRFDPHLDKSVEPYPAIYVRDYDARGNQIDAQLYRVHGTGDLLLGTFFATDREPYDERADDVERYIYALASAGDSGSIEARLDSGKLYRQLIYRPYCIEQGEDDIEQIGILTDREFNLIRSELINAELDAAVLRLLEPILEVFGQTVEDLSRDEYAALDAVIRPVAELEEQFVAFRDQEADAATYRTILTEPSRVRLRPTPMHLVALIDSVTLRLPDYTVVRPAEGDLYFRNVANDSTADNLLSKPSCPLPQA